MDPVPIAAYLLNPVIYFGNLSFIYRKNRLPSSLDSVSLLSLLIWVDETSGFLMSPGYRPTN
ncbi:MAG: hypothetical protein A2157_04735 [Deltaproteobacteria bacterium RBG_16_47_11]|nr:MAG: hypothetical protein A2157_04735 [Deltaproteobacteria bacterium RBG_16_47_11]